MDAPVKAGDIIDGRYRLERIIGTGGMAVVVAAIDMEVSERVALKFLFRKAAKHKEILRRFEREQAVISRLGGEHVARMLDSGVVRNTPYMVMEYLQGRDLAEVLRVQKTLPVEHAAEYILQACDAVAEAHGYAIVHRDLKPGNLFLTHHPDGSPCIKVFDFGIAKILAGDEEEGSLTRTEVVMGSPFYMSPEQMVSAKDVGASTDVWSLGVICYELVSGKLPFAAKNVEKVCARVLNDEPTPLAEVLPSCPAGLDEVLRGCLQRMPGERYPDVGEFAAALAPYAPSHARILAHRAAHRLRHPEEEPRDSIIAPEIVSSADPEAPPEAPTVYLPRKSRRVWKPALFVAFGAGMLGMGFAGGMYFRGSAPVSSAQRSSEPPVEAASASSAVEPRSGGAARTSEEEDEELALPEAPIEIDLDEEIRRAEAEKRRQERERQRREAAAKSAAKASASPPTASASSAEATATESSKDSGAPAVDGTAPSPAPDEPSPPPESTKSTPSGTSAGTSSTGEATGGAVVPDNPWGSGTETAPAGSDG